MLSKYAKGQGILEKIRCKQPMTLFAGHISIFYICFGEYKML